MGGGGLPGAAGGRCHARPASAITGLDGRLAAVHGRRVHRLVHGTSSTPISVILALRDVHLLDLVLRL